MRVAVCESSCKPQQTLGAPGCTRLRPSAAAGSTRNRCSRCVRTAAQRGGLLEWGSKLLQGVVIPLFTQEPNHAALQQNQEQQPAPSPPQQQQQQQQQPTLTFTEAELAGASAAPTTAPAQDQPQAQPQQERIYHFANGSSTLPGSSTGAIKANANDLLAGVPLQQMRERQRVQQQLQRQQQQLGGMPGASPGSAASSTPSSSSSSSGSLWGSTVDPAGMASNSSATTLDSQAVSGSLRAELSPVTSPEAAVAFAAYQTAVSARRLVPVLLSLQLQTEEGQQVKVVGGHKSLGKWDLITAPGMQHMEGDRWEASIKLPAGSVTEYKYAVVDAAGRPVAMQAGNNGVLAVGFADERLEVQDCWAGDAAGVSVIVDGDRSAWPATRESRLVSWANELFQQVANLRQDLRQSRMELIGAQEESREARLEAQRLLGELEEMKESMAELAAERQVDRADLAHTRALNQVLQAQLADTTASLKEAIQTASDLLANQEQEA